MNMSNRADNINLEINDNESLPIYHDWSHNQSGGFFRRAIDTVLGVLALILFLLYPTIFML
jgi:lipopolysaccharide/colanic/teichoic acid biosynthesis glycosyltransferase